MAVLAAVVLAGCGGDEGSRSLTLLGRNDGPNEFAMVPSKPLQQPEDLTALPEPTPGGVNRADRTPEAEAIAALGGDRGAIAGPSPSADAALLANASRFGVDPNIRAELAFDHQDYMQQRRGFLRRPTSSPEEYLDAYDFMALDQATMHHLARRVGTRVVGAQPMAVSEAPIMPAPPRPREPAASGSGPQPQAAPAR